MSLYRLIGPICSLYMILFKIKSFFILTWCSSWLFLPPTLMLPIADVFLSTTMNARSLCIGLLFFYTPIILFFTPSQRNSTLNFSRPGSLTSPTVRNTCNGTEDCIFMRKTKHDCSLFTIHMTRDDKYWIFYSVLLYSLIFSALLFHKEKEFFSATHCVHGPFLDVREEGRIGGPGDVPGAPEPWPPLRLCCPGADGILFSAST